MKGLIFTIILFIGLTGFGSVNIPLSNSNISYDGVFYTNVSDTLVTFNRHLPSMISDWESGIGGQWINQWVICQTGVRIRFKTASPTIQLSFKKRTGGGTIGGSPTNGFTIFVDGAEIQSFSTLSFTIQNPQPGTAKTFEVSLPNLWAVDFAGMQIDDNYSLENPGALNKPVYVAIGNSITHGTGQYVSSAKGYPFILARKMNWDLHNIAVAGATLGWAIAKNIKGKKVDVITIKIGFNDWKYSGASLATKKLEYAKLLDTLRAYQPSAMIYCITPLFTSDNSGAAPYTIQDFRDMVEEVVQDKQKNDDKLCLIYGPQISDASMLASGDPVHLSEYGANLLANSLYTKINDCGKTSAIELFNSQQKNIQITSLSREEIIFNCSESGQYIFSVYSMDGVKLLSREISADTSGMVNQKWETEQWPSGMYIVRLSNAKDSCSSKVILK